MAKAVTIKVNIAPDEKDRIQQAAKTDGLSISAYVRQAAIKSTRPDGDKK